MYKMTKAEALAIQARQVEHYAAQHGEWVREAVAAATQAEALGDGAHDIADINRHIPRGAAIELIIAGASPGAVAGRDNYPMR
jgi:hypothetical protein